MRANFSGLGEAVLLQALVLLSVGVTGAKQRDIWVLGESPGYGKAHEGVLADMSTRGITPVRAQNLAELRDNVLAELDSGECIRYLYATTTIRYSLPYRSHVTLLVFNTLGQKVADLENGDVDAGYHEVQFNAGNPASGVYFYRLQAGSYGDVKQLVLMK